MSRLWSNRESEWNIFCSTNSMSSWLRCRPWMIRSLILLLLYISDSSKSTTDSFSANQRKGHTLLTDDRDPSWYTPLVCLGSIKAATANDGIHIRQWQEAQKRAEQARGSEKSREKQSLVLRRFQKKNWKWHAPSFGFFKKSIDVKKPAGQSKELTLRKESVVSHNGQRKYGKSGTHSTPFIFSSIR